MSIHFTSFEMIKNQFDLGEESIENLRLKLRAMQAKLHPDKNGGSFIDGESERQYHELNEAISFIDSMGDNSHLVTISAVTDLTNAVTAMVAANNERSGKATLLADEINRSIESYNSKLKMPRIALTAITVVISGIWMFPNTVKEHTILSKFINFDSMITNLVWVFMLLYAALLWFLIWKREERTKKYQESLKTESVQNRLFNDFTYSIGDNSFTLEEFVRFIMYRNESNRHSAYTDVPVYGQIDSLLAHVTAEVILERALKRKALTSSNSGSISTVYQIVSVIK